MEGYLMSFKMKFRHKVKFAATSLLMLFGANSQLHAQNTAQAVMAVTVKVVSAPEFVSNIVTDITDQLEEATENLSLGEYSIKFPENSSYSISHVPQIKMKGETGSWDINTSVQQVIDNDGKITLNFTGKSTTSSVPPGQYTGQLTTQIDYY